MIDLVHGLDPFRVFYAVSDLYGVTCRDGGQPRISDCQGKPLAGGEFTGAYRIHNGEQVGIHRSLEYPNIVHCDPVILVIRLVGCEQEPELNISLARQGGRKQVFDPDPLPAVPAPPVVRQGGDRLAGVPVPVIIIPGSIGDGGPAHTVIEGIFQAGTVNALCGLNPEAGGNHRMLHACKIEAGRGKGSGGGMDPVTCKQHFINAPALCHCA